MSIKYFILLLCEYGAKIMNIVHVEAFFTQMIPVIGLTPQITKKNQI